MTVRKAASGAPVRADSNRFVLAGAQLGSAITVTTTASSQNLALPLDANGKAYPAVFITSATGAYFQFSDNAGDAIVAGSNDTYYVPTQFWEFIGVPDGATRILVIQDSVAGKFGVIGIL